MSTYKIIIIYNIKFNNVIVKQIKLILEKKNVL